MRREWVAKNPEAAYRYQRNWWDKNRHRTPGYKRKHRLKVLYGLSVEDYESMLKSQDGKCAVCNDPPGVRKLAVDHDHVTGLARELLCTNCNAALGHVKDDPRRLQNLIEYLHRHGDPDGADVR